jgi:ribosomal protein S18 acetylase RimI-like enzyme
MKEILREYKKEDYQQCESLVNEAWGFDKIFAPKELSDLAKCLYTKGSVLGSTYRMVVEVDGKVAGFIFGLNECLKRPSMNILYRFGMLWRLIRVKSEKPENKNDFLNAIKDHERNRTAVVGKGKSEIVLFVVGKAYQGKGYGKKLWSGFQGQCKDSGVCSVIVETNKLGASSFYELLGFRHLDDFESPLHEFATQDGQACVYEYVFK